MLVLQDLVRQQLEKVFELLGPQTSVQQTTPRPQTELRRWKRHPDPQIRLRPPRCADDKNVLGHADVIHDLDNVHIEREIIEVGRVPEFS